MDLVVGEGNVEAVAEVKQLLFVELLLLVCDIASLASLAQPIALDRACQDDGGSTAVSVCSVVRRIHLVDVVAAQPHAPEFVVAQVLDHMQQGRVDAPEVLANVSAASHGVFLVFAVDDFAHAPHEPSFVVFG